MSSLIRGCDGSQDLVRGRVRRCPVADYRARVTDEVRQRHDATLAQRVGTLRGVGHVRGGRDDADASG
jgi:hypothetical protein